jgi:glycine cleavage system regulatory protein
MTAKRFMSAYAQRTLANRAERIRITVKDKMLRTITTSRTDDDDSNKNSNSNSNKKSFIVTGYGRDRAGIYAAFSRAMHDIKAEVESSRLARLSQDFVVTALVSFQGRRSNQTMIIKEHLQKTLDGKIDGFTFAVREVSPETNATETKNREKFKKIIIRATNFPGITARITETLSSCQLSIETLTMDTRTSPFGGNRNEGIDHVYFCETTVRALELFSDEKFAKEMKKLEDELACDVEIVDVSSIL